jgi:hypothetical protein
MIIAALVLSLACQDDDFRPKELRELESLRQDVETLRVIDELKLTKEQREKLVAAIDAGRAKIDGAAKDAAEAIERITKATREQRDAMLKGEAFSDEKMRELGDAHERVGAIYRANDEASRALTKEARSILTAAQVDELGWVSRHDPVAQVRRWARQSLPRLRELPEEAFDQGGVEAIIQFVTHFPAIPEEQREDEAVRIHDIVVEARKMDDKEFESKSADLVKKIISEGKIAEIGKRMPRPPEGDQPLGRFLLQPRVARLLKERK